MEPHEYFLEGALVHSDADAQMRLAVVEAIRKVVQSELTIMSMEGKLYAIVQSCVRSMEPEIKRMALRALKEHFNNPQMIY